MQFRMKFDLVIQLRLRWIAALLRWFNESEE